MQVWFECRTVNSEEDKSVQDPAAASGYIADVDEEKFGRRVREFRLARKLTLEDVADQMGWGPKHQYVQKIEKGARGISGEEIHKLARILDVTIEQLLGLPARHRLVSLLGEIGRGGEYYAHPRSGRWMEIEKVVAPLGDEEVNASVRVVGAHMSPYYFDGDLLFFRFPGDPDINALIGKRCIVQVRDDKACVAVLEAGARRDRYSLRVIGGETMPNVQIEWAAKIRWCGQN
jgi:transcriptional regulator with XRE-family HTH domain